MNIEIIKVSPWELDREVWRFYLDCPMGTGSIKVKVDQFCYEVRETKRHGWKLKAGEPVYNRLRRNRGYGDEVTVPPVVPEDVLEDLKKELVNKLEFRLTET